MRNLFSSFFQHEYVQTLLRWISVITAPIRSVWAAITAPLQPVLAPLRTKWASFAARYPRSAWAASWIALAVRWCFYFLLFLVFGVWIGLFGGLPNSEELKTIETANATEIYTVDSVLIGRFYVENRTTITLDKISPYVVTALLATEDKRFFEHSGIDLQSWLRVAYGFLSGKESLAAALPWASNWPKTCIRANVTSSPASVSSSIKFVKTLFPCAWSAYIPKPICSTCTSILCRSEATVSV